MKLSSTLVAAWLALVAGHGDHGGQHIPKLVGGRRFLSDMRMRRAATVQGPTFAGAQDRSVKQPQLLDNRQIDDNTDGKCGPGVGSCAPGYCCSAEG